MRRLTALSACLLLPLTMSACGGSGGDAGTATAGTTSVSSSSPATSTPAAGDATSAASTTPPAELTSLTAWKGQWNNIARYLDDPALAPGYEAAATKNASTPDKEKGDLKERRASDFGGLTIEGETITFLSDFPSRSGTKISSSRYTFDKTYESVIGGKTRTWYAFRATAADARYPVVMFFPIDPEEDLKHFHLRYGKDPQEMLAKENWFPTVVAPETTTQQLITEISE